MSQSLRSSAVRFSIALGMPALNPSPVLASDYGPLVRQVLFMLAAIGGVALILAAATAAVLVRACRSKWIWLLTPIFAVGWFAVVLGIHELYLYLSGLSQGPEPPPMPVPEPEGVRP